ncbi:MAG: hypothetical protein HRT61_04400 [Ekhidna sp.]|nr:hypothetical protein [Ekhidna sp.]
MIKLLLVISLFSNELFHEFKIGRYEIRENQDDITLFVKLDRNDFLEAIKKQNGCSDSEDSERCMTEYLIDHFKLNFDGSDACFAYQGHELKDEFVEMTFQVGIAPQNIEEIKVFNNMLLEQYPKQENIVFFMLNDNERSFRLNWDRVATVVVY